MKWLFYYVVLAELVLHLIANQRSSFIRCIGSSPIYYAHAACPIGRGCCLENSLDVKVSGVRIPNTAVARNAALMCGGMGNASKEAD